MEIVEPIRDKVLIKKLADELEKKSIDYKLMFLIGVNIGLRVSDIVKMNITDVDGRDKVRIREQKTGKYKEFVLNGHLKSEIERYLKHRKKHYKHCPELFIRGDDEKYTRSMVYKVLNEVAAKVGITDNIGTHTMRKTFGYHLYKKTKDIALLQKIFNHSSPDISLRYIGIEQDFIDNIYRNFELGF